MEESQQAAKQIGGQKLETALTSQDIPHIYVNGFVNALSNSDIIVVLERHRSQVAVLSMSYTTAKSLAQKLSETIAAFESATGQTIMTTDFVNEALSKQSKGKS